MEEVPYLTARLNSIHLNSIHLNSLQQEANQNNNQNDPALDEMESFERQDLARILDLIETSKISAQRLLDMCIIDKQLNPICQKYEHVIWTKMLERDYPTWGVLSNAKEYYLRIARLNGIDLKRSSSIAGILGKDLLNQQSIDTPGAKTAMMQIGDLQAFPVANLIAETYSKTLSKLIDFNNKNGIADQNSWTYKIPPEEFVRGLEDIGIDVNTIAPKLINDSMSRVAYYFRQIFSNQVPSDTFLPVDPFDEYLIIKFTSQLQCQDYLCDSLVVAVEQRMTRLAEQAKTGDVFLEPDDILVTEFNVAPGYVHLYLRAVSDLLYNNDSFTPEIIDYYEILIAKIPTIRVSLMPHGYPFTRRENIDKLGPKAATLFMVNPLETPHILPDYMNAHTFAKLDTTNANEGDPNDPRVRIWRAGLPPPIIEHIPSEEIIQQRMEIAQPRILGLLREAREQMLEVFPNGEAGFVLAGGMLCMALDDWLSSDKGHFLLRTDGDFFIYGQTDQLRRDAFKIFFAVVVRYYPSDHYIEDRYYGGDREVYSYTHWKSVITVERKFKVDENFVEVPTNERMDEEGKTHMYLGRFMRRIGLQIINTNSKDAFEVIMNFDCSHIQVGWDCHRRWIATPFWQLYTPRRESLLVRYNIRSPRFIKALYRGFTLKKLMPYAMILTPKGIGYSYILREDSLIYVIPNKWQTYTDDLPIGDGNDLSMVRLDHLDIRMNRGIGEEPGDNGETHGPDHARSQPQDCCNFAFIKIITTKEDANGVEHITEEKKNIRVVNTTTTNNKEFPIVEGKRGKDVNDIARQVEFNGKFKNGFDAYVREQYLTYDMEEPFMVQYRQNRRSIAGSAEKEREEQIENLLSLKAIRYVMRDCKLLVDPLDVPVQYPGTIQFCFSLRTLITKSKAKILSYNLPQYIYDEKNKREAVEAEKLTTHDRMQSKLYNSDVIATEVKGDDNVYEFPEDKDLGEFTRLNTQLVRNRYCVPMMIEGIIPLKKFIPPTREEIDSSDSGYDEPDEYLDTVDEYKANREDRVFDVDALDLHERTYTDEEREAMPVYNFEQWQAIRMGEIKVGNVGAIRVQVPVVIVEALFLDTADWVMSIEDVIRNRENYLFNCMCYQNYTSRDAKGNMYGGEIKIYRSFLIPE